MDRMVARVLSLVFEKSDDPKQPVPFDADDHHERARAIAAQCIVLLKNEASVLPLAKDQPLAVIGPFAKTPRYQGGGSSHINPTKLSAALDEILQIHPNARFCDGYGMDTDDVNSDQMNEAIQAAAEAGTAVVFAGLPDHYESEGYDRAHMRIPPNQSALIEAVAAVCPNTVVVLSNGSPVEMPWIDKVPAVVEGYLAGQASGGAIADILFGTVNPSAWLAESFPVKLEDNPSYLNFPGHGDEVAYREGLYVGYRYYDKKKMDVLFPFGHGLSYTDFDYSDLICSTEDLGEDDTLTVRVTVQNTGIRAGGEVVQLYLGYPETKIDRVLQELKGFEKVFLQPGEAKTVAFTLNRRSFAYYDTDASDWLVETGPVEIRVGASSRDIRLTGTVRMTASRIPPKTFSLNSSRMDFLEHPVASAIARPFFEDIGSFSDLIGNEEREPEVGDDHVGEGISEEMMAETMAHMPLRSLILFSGGAVPEEKLLDLIRRCNEAIRNLD